MTDKNELIEKLSKFQKFNIEKSAKFSEYQKIIYKQKRNEFYSLSGMLRELSLEKNLINSEISNNLAEFKKIQKYSTIAILIYAFIAWFFDVNEKIYSVHIAIFLIYFVYIYFNKRIIEERDAFRITSKNESIKHYEFLLNYSVGNPYGEYAHEYNKLKEKKLENLYYEETEEEKLMIRIFDASISTAIIEYISDESFSYI